MTGLWKWGAISLCLVSACSSTPEGKQQELFQKALSPASVPDVPVISLSRQWQRFLSSPFRLMAMPSQHYASGLVPTKSLRQSGQSLTFLIEGDYLYLANGDGKVQALNLHNGHLHWQRQVESYLTAGPGLSEKLLLLGDKEGDVLALDDQSGAVIWRAHVDSQVLVAPVGNAQVVIVRSIDGKVYGLNASTGKRLWVKDVSLPALTLHGGGMPLLLPDRVLVGMSNGQLLSLDWRTGKTHWAHQLAEPRGRNDLERMVDADSPLIFSDGVVYAATYQGKLVAIEVKTGKLLWSRKFSSYTGGVLLGDSLFFSDAQSHVWAIHRKTGASLWQQDELHYRGVGRPVVINQQLVLSDHEGYLYSLSLDDGRILNQFRLEPGAIRHFIPFSRDKLAVLNEHGILTVARFPEFTQ
jgi:outer membrane protein assembly factor BamB